MKNSLKTHNGIVQFIHTLNFTEKELIDRVNLYLNIAPEKLYKSDIVEKNKRSKTRKNGYIINNKSYCEIIAKEIIKNKNKWVILQDLKCTYNNKEKRKKSIYKLRETKCSSLEKSLKYCLSEGSNNFSETKLIHVLCVQEYLGEFKTVDYQVPTSNGQKDNIDIVLEDANNVYIVEAKTFGSNESLLRCVLEIETYYKKINSNFEKQYSNGKPIKKAILLDKTSWAYEQKEELWAKELLKEFDITVLELSSIEQIKLDNKFNIKKI